MAKRKLPARPKDLVLQALHGIRADIKGLHQEQVKTNERLDKTIERLDKTIERLDHTVDRLDRLERRVTEGFIETNTKLADLSGQVDGLSGRLDSLSGRVESGLAALGDRIENVFTGQFGQDVRDLKERVRVLEGRFVHERPPPYGEPK